MIDDLLTNYSAFSGQYLKTLWVIYDLFMNVALKMPQSIKRADLFDVLATKYEDSLELTSPYCLASLVQCSRNFVHLASHNQVTLHHSFNSTSLSCKMTMNLKGRQGDV